MYKDAVILKTFNYVSVSVVHVAVCHLCLLISIFEVSFISFLSFLNTEINDEELLLKVCQALNVNGMIEGRSADKQEMYVLKGSLHQVLSSFHVKKIDKNVDLSTWI